MSKGFEYDPMDQDTQDRVKDPRHTLSSEQRKRWMKPYPEWRTANLIFRNRGDGTFEPKSAGWGLREEGLAFGMALGDLDQAGDLDGVLGGHFRRQRGSRACGSAGPEAASRSCPSLPIRPRCAFVG